MRYARIVIILYIYHPHLFCGRGVPRPPMRYALYPYCYSGEACLAPTKPCEGKAINTILLPLRGAHELQILRLFIPKHHCRLLRAHRVRPYELLTVN